jgi:hypothetical protein
MAPEHAAQNVHSKLQMKASPSPGSEVRHRSHAVRISSAIAAIVGAGLVPSAP